MRAVIILKGKRASGKSSTLKELLKLFINSNYPIFHNSKPMGVEEFWDSPYDGLVIFDIDGKLVGIITMGDPGCEHETEQYREVCLKHNCEILVAATRTKYNVGSVYASTYDFAARNGATLLELSPFTAPRNNDWGIPVNTDRLNHRCAQNIKSVIMDLI